MRTQMFGSAYSRGFAISVKRRTTGSRRNLSPGCLLLLGMLLALTAPGAHGGTLSARQGMNPGQGGAASQPAASASKAGGAQILITVVDETGLAVSSAQVKLINAAGQTAASGETDFAGRWEAPELAQGIYKLQVEKEGFYALTERGVHVGEIRAADVTLNHEKEYTQSVNVVYSPPAINPAQTTSSEQLTSTNIINLPYTVTRDIRYALPLLPGVVQDGTGQIHVNGAATRQTVDELDGFNISGPASGLFNLRVNVDAIRSVDLQTDRYPAEFGKGSGGILSLTTGMGDDHFRYSATDFFPGVQNRHGLHFNIWQPRAMLSGPLRKGKAWFLLAPEAEYNLNVVQELPRGADRGATWRFGNLAKAQWNWSPRHILTASYLLNTYSSQNYGLTQFSPLETTVNLRNSANFFALKDQTLLASGGIFELGAAYTRFRAREAPQGTATYQITPDGTRGNFYAHSTSTSSRLEGIANLFLPSFNWRGKHEVRMGVDADRLNFDETVERRPLEILREDGTLAQEVSFSGQQPFGKSDVEASAYAQDRWFATERAVANVGVRMDWDQAVHRALISPRLAVSYQMTRHGETKLVGGGGIYYDATSLEFITRPLAGERFDVFYDPTGKIPLGPPVETRFERQGLVREPRFFIWSAGIEHMLPYSTLVRLEYIEKRGRDGWTYENTQASPGSALGGLYQFQTTRRDQYDSILVMLRHSFGGGHVVMVSYQHSRARSNQVLDFNLDNPVFSPQVAGPLPWDSPNRVLSWGFLPLRKGFNFAYSADWHTGFPFGLVNEEQQLVAPPGARRFPDYFALNVAVERRFRILGFLTAIRVGLDDATNRHNATAVDNNVDSPRFLTFAGLTGRAFVARLRLLGRK